MRKNDTGTARALFNDAAVALVLLTRLPLPRLPDAAFTGQARAAWAFPLAGIAVALIAGAAGLTALALGVTPAAVALLVIAAQIALTGAMHEDGLADTVDGLWGGFTRERRLEIMKDSRIGSYGVLVLVIGVGLRWAALAALIAAGHLWGPLLAAAALSRGTLPALMTVLPPARPGGLSSSVGRPGRDASLAALALGAALALVATGPAVILPALAALLAVLGLAHLARIRIGGQTGDILGAAQQLAEIVLLLGLQAALAG